MKPSPTLAFLFCLFTQTLFAQTFAPDTLFGQHGLSVLDNGSNAPGRATMITVAADGKILLGGYSLCGLSEPFTIARFMPNGDEDLSFGADGVTQHAKFEGALKLAALPDGKILVLLPRGFQVARLNADGSEDTSFQSAPVPGDENRNTYSTDLLVQPDGKILVTAFGPSGPFDYYCVARFEPDGALDTGFGIGGMARLESNWSGYANALALQSDGKILVTGSNGYDKVSVARYRPDGTPDPDFDTDGLAIWPLVAGGTVHARGIAVQPDGMILIGADISHSPKDFAALYRMQSNGQPDPGFGSAGVATSTGLNRVYSLCLQSDGKALLCGLIEDLDDYTAILRFATNGAPDPAYQGSGSCNDWIANNDGEPMGFTLQPDDKLLAAIPTRSLFAPTDGFIGIRLLPSGQKDEDFGFSGVVYTGYDAGDDFASDLTLQSDGKVLVIGDSYNNYLHVETMIARFNTDGTLDAGFGTQGKVLFSLTPPNSNYAYGITLQPDGKILAAIGFSYSNIELKIVRFNADGKLDLSFGTGGVVAVPGSFFRVADLLLQPDGKILIAATSSDRKFTAIRLLANGAPDNSFGSGGTAALAPGTSTIAVCNGIALTPDGKIVLGGLTGLSDAAVVRFKANGQPDASFSGDGKAVFPIGSAFYVYSMALQADGKIVLGGSGFTLIRVLADGSGLDPAFGTAGVLHPASGSYCNSISVLTNGNLLAVGRLITNSATMLEAVTIKPDGTIPPSGIYTADPGGYGYSDFTKAVLAPDGKILLSGGVRQATDLDFGVMRCFTGASNATHEAPAREWAGLASPNPFTTQLHFNFQNLPAPAEAISVYNAAGQVVYAAQVDGEAADIRLENGPGLYLLRVRTGAGYFCQRLIKI